MTNRSTLIKRVHATARASGLDEHTRRAVYARMTGRTSLTAMTDAEIAKVADALSGGSLRMGVKRRKASEKAYVRLIFALWRSIGENGGLCDRSSAGLKRFVEAQTGVSEPDWLTYEQANPVIRALKSMERRAKTSEIVEEAEP